MLKFWAFLCELSVSEDLGTSVSVKTQATGLGWLWNAAGAWPMGLTLIAPIMLIRVLSGCVRSQCAV